MNPNTEGLRFTAEQICKALKKEGKKVKVKRPPAKKGVLTDDFELVYWQLDRCTMLGHQGGLSQLGIHLNFENDVYRSILRERNVMSAGQVCNKKTQDAMLDLRIKAVIAYGRDKEITFDVNATGGVDLESENRRLKAQVKALEKPKAKKEA